MDRHETPDEIQERMKILRKRLRRQAGFAADDARQLMSWQRLVARHPLTSMGIALVIGYVIVPRLKIPGFTTNKKSVARAVTEQFTGTLPQRRVGLGSVILRNIVSAAASLALARATKLFLEPIRNTMDGENKTTTSNGHVYVPRDVEGQS
jgi:hypothetical protein